MNYEQKYKEALKAIESLYNIVKYQSSSDALLTCQTIEKAFPELCESEDERIRKEIIQSIQDNMCVIHKDKCLAWLEKQGEKKSAEWSEEDKEILDGIIDTLDGLCLIDQYRLNWLKSLKPHWKPNEEQIEIIDMILTNESMDDNVARIMRELKEQFEKL